MKKQAKIIFLTNLALVVALPLSACGAGRYRPTPTPSVEEIQTEAVGTYAAGLTWTAIAQPTNTTTSTLTPTATPTPPPTAIAAVPTTSCFGLTGINDVTIPDNTPMVPGQAFTKSWLVKNSGTCSWAVGFKFVFTSGDAMGGSSLVLAQAVAPGAQTTLSVPMTAPAKAGSVRGNWRMSTLTGEVFGDVQFVIINLSGTPATTGTSTVTITPAATTATPTPSQTPTPTTTAT